MIISYSNLAAMNLLPYDGEVVFSPFILNMEKADHYFIHLLNNISWQQDEVKIYGKTIVTKRKVAWYGDKDYLYTYSKSTKRALPFTPELLDLKNLVEKESGYTYNSCLLNLYHSGQEGMSWHSDNEPELLKNGAIASLSLGADRKFVFKHETTKEKREVFLTHGSLLVMKGTVQKFWKHALPTTKKILTPRINLTFRTIVVK
jgi:alkylated DNA repair dioxygenase AlkB